MNIFALDYDPVRAAMFCCTPHLIKMVLESAQMLCTVYAQHPSVPIEYLSVELYRPTHVGHPCTKWVAESIYNWRWLKRHAAALDDERMRRFDSKKPHKSMEIILELPEPVIPNIPRTSFAMAMPDKYKKQGYEVESYRHFYVDEKAKLLTKKFKSEKYPYVKPNWWFQYDPSSWCSTANPFVYAPYPVNTKYPNPSLRP